MDPRSFIALPSTIFGVEAGGCSAGPTETPVQFLIWGSWLFLTWLPLRPCISHHYIARSPVPPVLRGLSSLHICNYIQLCCFCTNIVSMHLLVPRQTSIPWIWASGKHSAKTATHWCWREPKQAQRQYFYSDTSIDMQMLGYPSLVTQKEEMTLYVPDFQDVFASIAMVSWILLGLGFFQCSAALFFHLFVCWRLFVYGVFFFSVATMPT